MFVKICGIRDLRELAMVENYADATGVVVECESKRRISLEKAKEIIENAKIPVFVVSTLRDFEGWSRVVERTEAKYVQIHTDSIDPIDVERLKREFDIFIMKAFKISRYSDNPEGEAEKLLAQIEQFEVDRILLDTGKGSGVTHDHRVSRIIARKFDIVLAGGLNPQNVAEIVRFVRPYGVDVSSGVENNGRKDEELIKRFVEALGEFR